MLVGVLVVAVLGLVAAELSGLTHTLVSIQGALLGGSSDTTQTMPDVPIDPVGGAIPDRPSEAVAMTVEHVHDGDTLFLQTAQANALVATTDVVKVRLLGIDTPEVGDSVECFGDQATEQLRTLLPDGSRTWITADQDPTDRYGRSLFYLWTDDGAFVNYELVARGAAESLMIAPNDAYYPMLRAAEDAARAAGAGMWSVC